ncbi:MAG TPA: hypothetical protein VHE79_11135 [Spirochaetia bacterium]
MRAVVAALPDIPTELMRVGQLSHPFPCPWRLVVDRVSFCDPFLRQVMRYWSFAGCYVLNDPFFTLVFDKLTELHLYDTLGICHPRTVLLPRASTTEDLSEIVAEPQWEEIEATVGMPCILKPVDGYAWQDVFRVDDPSTLRGLYESLKTSRTLIVQELVRWESYYRAFAVGGDVLIVRWKPLPFDRGVYAMPDTGELGATADFLRAKTAALNALQGLDFNTVEWCVTGDGTPFVIDSFNDVPDVRKEKLPPQCWDWIVDRFSRRVRERLADGARNTLLPQGLPVSDPGAPPG